MANYALLTANGKDKPGIVAAIAKVLLASDCNIEDSQMARLGPDFAVMLVLRMPEGLLANQLEEFLSPLGCDLGLRIHLQDLRPEEAWEPGSDQPCYLIHVAGADRKGIVAKICDHLAARSVNITNLQTEVTHHHRPQYAMTIEAELPSFVDAARLESELSAIGKEIDVTVSMKPQTSH
jgi:glycine cleavage system transcriptional repressor